MFTQARINSKEVTLKQWPLVGRPKLQFRQEKGAVTLGQPLSPTALIPLIPSAVYQGENAKSNLSFSTFTSYDQWTWFWVWENWKDPYSIGKGWGVGGRTEPMVRWLVPLLGEAQQGFSLPWKLRFLGGCGGFLFCFVLYSVKNCMQIVKNVNRTKRPITKTSLSSSYPPHPFPQKQCLGIRFFSNLPPYFHIIYDIILLLDPAGVPRWL